MLDPDPQPGAASEQIRFVSSAQVYERCVPADHPLRKIQASLDLSFVRAIVAERYDPHGGRYAIEPELFARITLLQYLENLPDRETVKRCASDLAWKWFLGLEFDALAPLDYSTLSRIRSRYGEEACRQMSQGLLAQAREHHLIGDELHLYDSAESVANAAWLNLVQLVRTICERLVAALEAVLTVEEHEALVAQQTELREDTSWYHSQTQKDAHLQRWSVVCQELVERAEAILSRPGGVKKRANWKRVSKQLRHELAVAGHFLAAPAPRRKGGKKDRLCSPTDPDARRADRRKGKVRQGYRPHVAMDHQSRLVVAADATALNGEDGAQLPGLVAAAAAQGHVPQEACADSAYADGENRALLAEKKIVTHIPQPRPKASKKGLYIATDFQYDPEAHAVTCPAGQVCGNAKPRQGGGWHFYYLKQTCAGCPHRAQCIAEGETRGRTVYVGEHRALQDEATEHQRTPEHKAAMRKRLAIESKLAEMLNVHGLRHCRYRSLARFKIQLYLTVIAVNAKRIAELLAQKRKAGAAAGLAQAA